MILSGAGLKKDRQINRSTNPFRFRHPFRQAISLRWAPGSSGLFVSTALHWSKIPPLAPVVAASGWKFCCRRLPNMIARHSSDQSFYQTFRRNYEDNSWSTCISNSFALVVPLRHLFGFSGFLALLAFPLLRRTKTFPLGEFGAWWSSPRCIRLSFLRLCAALGLRMWRANHATLDIELPSRITSGTRWTCCGRQWFYTAKDVESQCKIWKMYFTWVQRRKTIQWTNRRLIKRKLTKIPPLQQVRRWGGINTLSRPAELERPRSSILGIPDERSAFLPGMPLGKFWVFHWNCWFK